jgi:ribA/ribD-fused uncharacterized protein
MMRRSQIAALRKRQEAISEPIEFSSKSAPYPELSNFYISPLTVGGRQHRTVESYFQSQKFPDFPAHQERIRMASSPKEAKKLGRERKRATMRSDWESVKIGVMATGLSAKFRQNPRLKAILLGTMDRELREKSRWDSYWGTGRDGRGKNQLGKLLMSLRDDLAAEQGPV